MSLASGTRLGPYEIIAPLGAGGMGEVYRARDTRLNRDVAVKVLPSHLSQYPDVRARFEREAKAISSLNHPHICTVHDVGHEGGVDYLVMELLEGESLAERVTRGALPVGEVLRIGAQIADALDKAHRKGLVHRDLKPGNIVLTKAGAKLLDFGLARASGPGAVGELTSSPTMGKPLTAEGTIVGTFQYMSPEQLEGKEPDPRSDIWALGATLYETATGRRAFEGKTQASLITSIMRDEPRSIAELVPLSPAALDLVVARCLAKDAGDRWQSAGDLTFALRSMVAKSGVGAFPTGEGAAGAAAGQRGIRGIRIAGIAALVISVGAIAGLLGWLDGRSTRPAVILSPHFTQLTDQTGEETAPSLSPDGTSFAYASRARGSWDIYVQRVGGRNATLVAGDPALDESAPAFSPDGASIAYHEARGEGGGIFIAGATGESARRLTDFGFNPAWSPDGKRIAFCSEEVVVPYSRGSQSALWVVDVAGGAPRKIFDGDAMEPAWSPSGSRIAFWGVNGGQRDLFTLPAEGGKPVAVFTDPALDWSPAWAPDGRYLYFASDRGGTLNLWRAPIDEASGRALGPPEAVTGGVRSASELPSLSRTGRLVFRSQLTTVNPVAIPFDLQSERLGEPAILARRTGLLYPTGVSADGRWLALTNFGERQEDIFVSRIDGSELRRLTDDAARDRLPVWSPTGNELAFYSNRSGHYEVWAIRADGSGLRRLSDWAEGDLLWPAYSPTGDRIVTCDSNRHRGFILDVSRSDGPERPQEIQGLESGGTWLSPVAWSPDGRRLAGGLIASAAFPVGVGVYDLETKKARKVNDDKPYFAGMKWLPDSRRLIFVTRDRRFVLLDVDSGRRRVLGENLPIRVAQEGFSIAPDGRTVYAGAIEIESDIWMMEMESIAGAR